MAFTPITVTLSEPVTHGKETFTSITFTRTMRGKDMIAMDAVQGGMRKTYALYASLAGVPIQVFLEMDANDLEEVASAVAGLTGKSSKPKVDEEASPEA